MMSVEIKISCLRRNGEDFCIITILTVICLNLGIDVSLILIPYFRKKIHYSHCISASMK